MPRTIITPAQFEAAPIVRRARKQIARLQEVIDYGVGDVGRAVKIREILEGSILHTFEHEAYVAVCGNETSLNWQLFDWSPAINSVCWEIDRLEREAAA